MNPPNIKIGLADHLGGGGARRVAPEAVPRVRFPVVALVLALLGGAKDHRPLVDRAGAAVSARAGAQRGGRAEARLARHRIGRHRLAGGRRRPRAQGARRVGLRARAVGLGDRKIGARRHGPRSCIADVARSPVVRP